MRPAVLAVAALIALGCGGSAAPVPEATPSAEIGSWRTLEPSRLRRTEVAAARVGRFIYVMGGFEARSGQTTAAVERYDIRRDRWTSVADMPRGLNHAAAAAHRGRVYVLGGYTAPRALDDEVATLYRYDPGRDRWDTLPAAPTRRGALAAGVIDGRLYAIGGAGAGAGEGALRTLEVYDLATRRWTTGPPMRTARQHLAATVAGGRLYVLAGRAPGRGNFAVAESYDPRRDEWTRLPRMRKARGGIAAAAVRGRIVVVGGEEQAQTIRQVEVYEPSRRRWRRAPDMPTPRHGLGAVSLGRRVFTLQGGDRPGYQFTNRLEVLRLGG